MDLTRLLLDVATAILAGGSLWAAVFFGRRAVREAQEANALAGERSVVEWHVARLHDDNPGWFYAANAGQDTAYEVTLVAWDGIERLNVEADAVMPYDNTDPSNSDYVEFRLAQREKKGPKPGLAPLPRVPTPDAAPGPLRDHLVETRRMQDEIVAEEAARRQRRQVWVRITWRSALGKWSTQTLQTG
ncbi:hypothetical protein [Mycobacterium novum]